MPRKKTKPTKITVEDLPAWGAKRNFGLALLALLQLATGEEIEFTPADLRIWRKEQILDHETLARLLNNMPARTVEGWENNHGKMPVFLRLALETVERRLKAAAREVKKRNKEQK